MQGYVRPVMFVPDLAERIGLKAAIALHIIHCQSQLGKRRSEHRWWVTTPKEMQILFFPFWSRSTTKRVLDRLKAAGFLHVDVEDDGSRWYRLDYPALEQVTTA